MVGTKSPVAILMRVRLPSAARDFFFLLLLTFNFQCRLSYGVHACNPRVKSHASTSLGIIITNSPNISSHIIVRTTEGFAYGGRIRYSPALRADAYAYSGMMTRVSHQELMEYVLTNRDHRPLPLSALLSCRQSIG